MKTKIYRILDLGNDNYLVLSGPTKIKNKLIIGKTYSGDKLEKLGYELDKKEDLEERVWIAYQKN